MSQTLGLFFPLSLFPQPLDVLSKWKSLSLAVSLLLIRLGRYQTKSTAHLLQTLLFPDETILTAWKHTEQFCSQIHGIIASKEK